MGRGLETANRARMSDKVIKVQRSLSLSSVAFNPSSFLLFICGNIFNYEIICKFTFILIIITINYLLNLI